MTPWTGRPGDPVPVALRHDLVTLGARHQKCARCERCWWNDDIPTRMDLCSVAVAKRLAELEAHEANLHKYSARVRGEIVRWLRAAAGRYGLVAGPRAGVGVNLAADAIARGEYVAWCEAHPVSTAPEDK